MSVDVGDEAPDFELQDQERQPVRLSSFRGRKNVVVVFYPMSFTPTCQGELCAIRDSLAGLRRRRRADARDQLRQQRRAQALGRRAGLHASRCWPTSGRTARWPGRTASSTSERGLALRGTFIVDKQGKVVYKVVNAIRSPRDLDEYRKVLAEL